MSDIIQKIEIDDKLSFDELNHEVEKGGEFIIYQYCISIFFAVTLTRFSPAIFIKNGDEQQAWRKKYNRLSYIFGWWGIPWGPINTIKSVKINNNGGVSVTKDIMLNITPESFVSKEVTLTQVAELFAAPIRSDMKAFEKTVIKDHKYNSKIKEMHVGLYINTMDNEEPYLVFGIITEGDFESMVEEIKTSLYKQYRKHAEFDFIDLSQESEINTHLIEEGVQLF